MTASGSLVLGWEEWVGLPGLGLPSIKAKVDTGAKTSALHAHFIEPFGPSERPMVRFVVNPVPGKEHIAVTCSAPIVDRREITSSNGDREVRFVVQAELQIAERSWPIDVTLTNRADMTYRMLLGRQAIRDDVVVDPTASFLQPRLSYKPYRGLPRTKVVSRPLRIGMLTRRPEAHSVVQIRDTARARGHELEIIDLDAVRLAFDDGSPELWVGDERGPHFDAVVPRVGERGQPYAAAIVRQIEMMGGFSLNTGDALDTIRDPLAVVQKLVRAGVPVRFAPDPEFRLTGSPEAAAPAEEWQALIVGRSISGWQGHQSSDDDVETLALRAANVLDLGLAAVHIGLFDTGLAVTDVDAVPKLSRYSPNADSSIVEAIVVHIETRVRSWSNEPLELKPELDA